MKLLEKIVLGCTALGLILKIPGIVGGTLLFVTGMSLLGVLYMFFGWWLFRSKTGNYNNTGLSVATGIGLANAAVGIMYKILCWPGSGPMLVVPLAVLIPMLIVFFIRYFIGKNADGSKVEYNRRMLIRSAVVLGIVAVTFITPLRTFAGMQHFTDPEEKRLYIRYIENPTCNECYNDWVNYGSSRMQDSSR